MTPVSEMQRRAFGLPVRVYYEDTDAAGVVYYAGYLRFLERGRTEWLRQLGVEQFGLAQDAGIAFAVRALNVEYLKAARLDDALTVVTELASLGRAQVVFAQRVERDGQALVEATVRVACIDARRMKPVAIPEEIRKKMQTP
jgi:acyl-CoA thioester hydrolase